MAGSVSDTTVIPNLKKILDKINFQVNAEHRYEPDISHFNEPDKWIEMVDNETGDCDDYMLTKRKILRDEYKIPRTLMRICICTVETGELHAVLCVRDNENGCDWILDNRAPTIRLPDETGYTFNRIQVPGTFAFEWVKQPV
jgi:predicted transglutaminase-like cysteine proteinase